MSKYNVHAGHNSIVPGAAKYLNEVTENRKVKNKLIQMLREEGHTVYDCTDEGGDTQSKNLSNIVAKCNAHSVDLDISIHLNAGGGTGTEVLYTSEKGKAYAAKVSAAVAAALGIKDRGAKERDDLYVLNHTKAPAILVECCFVDSTTDRDKWDVDKCVAAIVQGITGKAAVTENNTGTGSGKTDEAEKTETNKKETSSAKAVNYKVKINTASGVNVRKGPGEDYSKITAIANGKTVTITKEQDGWGYVKEYKGWICLKYTKKASESSADADCIFKVGNTYTLQANMVVRTGAGTNYRAKAHSELTADGQKHDKDKNGCLDKGTRVSCRKVKIIDDQIWILTPSGWICAKNGSKLYVK